jgi:hypothetical protein
VQHGIGLARAIERRGGEPFHAMITELEPGVLAGDKQPRPLAEGGERMGNRAELDRFRARSNNERNS